MAQKEAEGAAEVASDVKEEPVMEETDEDVERRQMMEEAKEKGLTCRTCDQFFASVEAQQAHFKSEWHLFNLQRKLIDQERVDEATFAALRESLLQEPDREDEEVFENDSSSEESQNEDDDEDDAKSSKRVGRGPRIRLTTRDGRVISFWRAILPSRDFEDGYHSLTTSQEQGSPQLQQIVRGLGSSRKWVFVMCSGGYFAGSVFDGSKVIAHKTFRRYTVRRKQGGSQSARDAKGNKPKSAGAFMRRYHEAQLQREIRELLEEWRPHFETSDLVFYYLPGGGINRHMFFYDGSPLGTKKGRGKGANPKLRSIPFHIERPSVTAIARAQEILSTIEIEECAENDSPPPPSETGPADDEAAAETSLAESREERREEEEEEEEARKKEEERRAEAEIIAAVRANDAAAIDAVFERIADTDLLVGAGSSELTPLYVACETGNVELVSRLLSKGQNINTRIPGYHYWTVLHRASADGNVRLVKLLLEQGADPTVKGLISKTPYDLAPNKETRHAFRRFAGDQPGRWDYDEAKIPPLTKEMEAESRKKDKEKKKKKKEALKARRAREREEEEARKRREEERRRAKQRREQEARERKRKMEEEEAERRRKAEQDELEADEELQLAIQMSLGVLEAGGRATAGEANAGVVEQQQQRQQPPSAAVSAATEAKEQTKPKTKTKERTAASGPECDLCHKRMGEKAVPFHRLSYKYCSTKCVQEHRRQLGK